LIKDLGDNTSPKSLSGFSQSELVSILRGFAGRLHEAGTTSSDRTLSVALHRKSEEIASILLEYEPFRDESRDSVFSGDAPENTLVLPTFDRVRDDASNWIEATEDSGLNPEPPLIPLTCRDTDIVA